MPHSQRRFYSVSKLRLGRGLDVLLKQTQQTAAVTAGEVRFVPLSAVIQAGAQPRQHFDEDALHELSESIRQHGVLQPLLVRPCGEQFEIIAGERRWRASQRLGLREIPVIVHDISTEKAFQIAIVENLQRENLSALEEAKAYQTLLRQGMTQDQLAATLGKGRSTITNTLRLLTLSDNAQQALEAGQISAGHARAILAHEEAKREWVLQEILLKKLSVRQAEALKSQHSVRKKATSCYQQLELNLSRKTGTRAKIMGKEKGRIELHYGSPEELNRILAFLGCHDDDYE